MTKSIIDMSDDDAKELFHDLRAQHAAILEKSAPLREARDAFVNETRAKEKAMNAEIRAAEKGLFEINQRSARIARMLGGKTGPVPGTEEAKAEADTDE